MVQVETYKTILRNILDRRPSGTRQRLASALGKNRSFVTHISNPAYPVPIPAPHLEIIFEVCHFSPTEKGAFLDAFMRAHPNRLRHVQTGPSLRTIKIEVPDLGNAEKNRDFEELVRETARRLARLVKQTE
ncbi:MAG: hypothetical protein JO273_15020 [Methylobacteriaceae bacterium]|nr:hypothetical protein [Methylobacteriaceae bacterium]